MVVLLLPSCSKVSVLKNWRRQQVGCRADRLHRRRSGAGAGGGRRDRRPDRRGAQEGEVGLADVGRDGGRGAAAVPRLPAAERDGAAIGLVVGLGLGGLARADRPERAAPDAEHGAGRPVRLPVAALRREGDVLRTGNGLSTGPVFG